MLRIPDFLESLKKMEEIHIKKNEDYSNESNPFHNFDFTSDILSHFNNDKDKVFVWPIACKLARLANLLNNQRQPNNESIEDSLIDIANYVLLWKADLNRRGSKPTFRVKNRCMQCKTEFSWSPFETMRGVYCSESCAQDAGDLIITSKKSEPPPPTTCRRCQTKITSTAFKWLGDPICIDCHRFLQSTGEI